MLNHKINLGIHKFSLAWIACMICMIQGDLSVISLDHAITASKTGSLAAIAFVACSFLPFKSDLAAYWLVGVLTALADFIVHPTHFGPEWAEAALTGAVAVFIMVVSEAVRGKLKW